MGDAPVVYAMIPARYGSERLRVKNLALINGVPMLAYAITAAAEAGVFDRVVVNSGHPIFGKVADRYGGEFYRRPVELGSSSTTSDEVVADFMLAYPDADVVAWVNPTSPLQTSHEVAEVVRHFLAEGLDSLITTQRRQVHSRFAGKPLNYDPEDSFARTQDLEPVELFVYSVMIWRRETFLEQIQRTGHAMMCGKFGTYAVSHRAGIIVKDANDLMWADAVARGLEQSNDRIEYDPIALSSTE